MAIDPVDLHIKLKKEGWMKSPDVFDALFEKIIQIEKALVFLAKRTPGQTIEESSFFGDESCWKEIKEILEGE